MTTVADRPVSCRAKHCRHSGPQGLYVRASVVLKRENARGWFCPECAGNGGTRVWPRVSVAPIHQGCPATLNGKPCILHPRNGHSEHVSSELEVWA